MRLNLAEDLHVHSTFSDGAGTLADNIAWAEAAGLRHLGCVDHVRAGTDWLPNFVSAVEAARRTTMVHLSAGVEAKFLDEDGTLDLPEDLDGIDLILAADHQLPIGNSLLPPRTVRDLIVRRALGAGRIVTALLNASLGAMNRYPGCVVAHPFSFLPKVGLDDGELRASEIEELARVSARTGSRLEVSERWRCPGIRFARIYAAAGGLLCCSTDAHRPKAIGTYDYVLHVDEALTHGGAR